MVQKTWSTNETVQAEWDLNDMVDQVRRALPEEVDGTVIRHTLIQILSKYEDAPVKTFVPIFACREAGEALQPKYGLPRQTASPAGSRSNLQ